MSTLDAKDGFIICAKQPAAQRAGRTMAAYRMGWA
jgi:hypothetical protein